MTADEIKNEIAALENQIATSQGALQAFKYVLDKLEAKPNPVDSVDTKEDSVYESAGV